MSIDQTASIEAELAEILQNEIWAEITTQTGKTKQDLDDKIIDLIKAANE